MLNRTKSINQMAKYSNLLNLWMINLHNKILKFNNHYNKSINLMNLINYYNLKELEMGLEKEITSVAVANNI